MTVLLVVGLDATASEAKQLFHLGSIDGRDITAKEAWSIYGYVTLAAEVPVGVEDHRDVTERAREFCSSSSDSLYALFPKAYNFALNEKTSLEIARVGVDMWADLCAKDWPGQTKDVLRVVLLAWDSKTASVGGVATFRGVTLDSDPSRGGGGTWASDSLQLRESGARTR